VQTDSQRYIVEITDSKVRKSRSSSRTQTGSRCPRNTRSCWWTPQGASIVDSGYHSVSEAKAAWPKAREPAGIT